MPSNIVVPELSESVVEATVSEWLKKAGDAVEAGEAVVVLETDKVSVEVTADIAGVLASIAHEEGADVTPGDVLGVIDGDASAAPPAPKKEEAPATQASTPAVAEASSGGAAATPVAQRVAAAHNVDIAQVNASSGKVTKADVESFISDSQKTAPVAKPAPQPAASANGATPADPRGEERIRMTRRRQTIARRLVEAQSVAAMLTTFNEVDMQPLMEFRSRHKESFKEKYGVSLGLSSFFVKASIGALKAFPYVNGEIQDKEIVLKHFYDIGIAIGAEEGLVVPVLRDADRMSFAEIESQIRAYAKQSQEGKLAVESLMGGTFTITNGGVFGSMMSTPILNPPQVGILGLHGIKDRPVVVDGEIVIRPMMYLALTYDHRIVDGREAVQFLVKVKDLIEDPERLLIEG
ncbi:MAG: 2-oxoglutarate dehydrogenase complex dihydrolipoyllysine-residue succinyltransferase [Aggregatilineales bacterium]